MIDKIHNEDCVEGMKNMIKSNTIDFIITDHPYQISKPSQFSTLKDRENSRTGTYFGEWNDLFDNTNGLEQASRVLKSGG